MLMKGADERIATCDARASTWVPFLRVIAEAAGTTLKPPSRLNQVRPDAAVQLQASALFSDGSRRYVTSLAVYEPSSQAVDVTANGDPGMKA